MTRSCQLPLPVGWKLVPNTATHNMLNAANAGRKKGRSSSGEIYRAMIEAAPAAPVQAIPIELFDGFAVLQAMPDRQRSRTSAENVADVLDAVVKLMRARLAEHGKERL